MAYSEFGRRVKANASQGTDHGTAGPVFLVGDRVRPGFHSDEPSLTDLDNGDLKATTDFRAVYGEVLDKVLGRRPHARPRQDAGAPGPHRLRPPRARPRAGANRPRPPKVTFGIPGYRRRSRLAVPTALGEPKLTTRRDRTAKGDLWRRRRGPLEARRDAGGERGQAGSRVKVSSSTRARSSPSVARRSPTRVARACTASASRPGRRPRTTRRTPAPDGSPPPAGWPGCHPPRRRLARPTARRRDRYAREVQLAPWARAQTMLGRSSRRLARRPRSTTIT